MRHRRSTLPASGRALAAVLWLTFPLGSAAQEAAQPQQVLPAGIEQDFRRAQRSLARRRPTSPMAHANIAIRHDRVEFLESTSGVPLAILRRAEAPPWFAPDPGQFSDSDARLLLQLLAEHQVASPWRASGASASRVQRDDWAGQPMRKPWQLYLLASVTWLALLAIGYKALRTVGK